MESESHANMHNYSTQYMTFIKFIEILLQSCADKNWTDEGQFYWFKRNIYIAHSKIIFFQNAVSEIMKMKFQ